MSISSNANFGSSGISLIGITASLVFKLINRNDAKNQVDSLGKHSSMQDIEKLREIYDE